MPPPSIEPLVAHAASLRQELGAGYQIPDFDPNNGGIDARALFLLEAPGPKAVVTGRISQDNPDPSARNMMRLLGEAGFDRREVVLWNVVPWYVGDGRKIRPVRPSDIQQALPYLRALLGLLTGLQVIVLVGRKAQAARADIAKMTGVPLVDSFHTSNLVMNRSPTRYGKILGIFQAARRIAAKAPR
jgi:uracil-DNA glycosylase